MVSQAQAVAAMLLAEADRHGASMRIHGTPTGTFLANRTHWSRKQAAGVLHDAKRLEAHPQTRRAVLDGVITMDHGRAVGRAIAQMPPRLTPAQTDRAETMLLAIAERATPDDVLDAAASVAAQLTTEADELEAARLNREREAAWVNRSLTWSRQAGSVKFTGCLPLVEGEAFTLLIDAYAQQARHDSAQDRLAQPVTPWQRRADALIALVDAQTGHRRPTGSTPDISHGAPACPSPGSVGLTRPGIPDCAPAADPHAGVVARPAPALAGDRPVVVVTLSYEALLSGAAHAGRLPSGQPVSPGQLRRLCCDANLIPVVLGSGSEPLDVGRAVRYVTPGIRKALHLRDKTCAFPHCDTPAHLCDAHHIKPWWQGGATALDNLVLLCPHHHGLIEPDKHALHDQWKVTMHADGRPVFHPPRRCPDHLPLRNTNAPPVPGG